MNTRKQKMTEWFPSHIKPMRVGWYHTRVNNCESDFNWWWDGRAWRLSTLGHIASHQNRDWRGLTKHKRIKK